MTNVVEHKFDQRLKRGPPNPGFKLQENKDFREDDLQKLAIFLSKYAAVDNVPRIPSGTLELETDDRTGKTVFVRDDETLTNLFKTFMDQGFSGCPVLDVNDNYMGFIDILDITAYTVRLFRETRAPGKAAFETFFSKSRRFKNTRVSDFQLMYRLGKKAPPTVLDMSSLLSVWETMVHNNARRVPILDNQGYLCGIITNSMMISTISQNLDLMPQLKALKVREFTSSLQFWVDKCTTTDLAVTAFETMVDSDHSGLPVVDSRGVLVDNLSIRDLREIGKDATRFSTLWDNVQDFKADVRKRFPSQTPWSPIVVKESDSMFDVITKMDDGNIHRVFVVDDFDQPRPLYVISQLDVLRVLLDRYRTSSSPMALA